MASKSILYTVAKSQQNFEYKNTPIWYGRFAANNGISLTEARKMLTTGQLEEFRWTVEQYIKVGKKKAFVDGGDLGLRKGSKKAVEKSAGSDIIKTKNAKEGLDVHFVGKINRDIYKCITEDIRTDEVIITDERILHVKERHPDDYERFCSYIPRIIQDPDYIVEANKANTAILLKEVTEAEGKFKLVLRISVKNDPDGYKNSVISFWHIGDTTWRKTLKNKNILYKKE